MNKPVLFVVAVAFATLCADIGYAEVETDDEIRSRLVMACFVEDDHPDEHRNVEQGMYDAAFRAAESNRVRFARIICDLAHTNYSRIAELMVSRLGEYGTSEQLPFLYSQASNTQYGVDAVRAVLKIEGITSNSVAMVDWYLSNTNAMMRRGREDVCIFMLDIFPNASFPGERGMIERRVLQFAANNSMYNRRFDEILSARIDGYSSSRRRLDVLRTVQQRGMGRGVNEYTLPFVTNAINELVSYPEADLPE